MTRSVGKIDDICQQISRRDLYDEVRSELAQGGDVNDNDSTYVGCHVLYSCYFTHLGPYAWWKERDPCLAVVLD